MKSKRTVFVFVMLLFLIAFPPVVSQAIKQPIYSVDLGGGQWKSTGSYFSATLNVNKTYANVGDVITLSTPSKGWGYTYKFVKNYNNWKEFGVISGFGLKNTAQFTVTKPGNYDVTVYIKDRFGNQKTATKKITVASIQPTLIMSKFYCSVGDSITLSTPTKKVGYRYKYRWYRNNWKERGTINDFRVTSNAYFTPNKAGTYYVYLDIKDVFGNVYTTSKKLTVASVQPVLKVDKSSCTVGDTITLSTPTTKWNYQYKFRWYRNNWKESGTIRGFGNVSQMSYAPNKAGTYYLYLDIKDQFGNVYSTYKKVTVASIQPVLKVDKSSCTVGDTITLSTPTTKSNYRYRYRWYRNNWKESGTIRVFGTSNRVSYAPNKAGTYYVYLDIMDQFGNIYSTYQKVTVAPIKPVLRVDKIYYTIGDKITLSTPTTKSNYKYKFSWSSNSNKALWGTISGYRNVNKVTYTPNKAGTYYVYLDIMDQFGNVYSTNQKVTVAPIKPVLQTDKSSYNIGDKITLTTPTTKPGYLYKFSWSRNKGRETGLVSRVGTTNMTIFTPTIPGTYEFTLEIKTSLFGEAYSVKKQVTVAPIKPVLETLKNSYTMGQTVVLFTPTTKSEYRYKFSWSRNDGKETGVINGFGTASMAIYTPTKPGTYDVHLAVRDGYGNIYSTKKQITVAPLKPSIITNKSSYTIGNTVTISTWTKKSDYKYKFSWSFGNEQTRVTIFDFNNVSRVNYTPTKPGTYNVYLDIKDGYGNIYSTQKQITVAPLKPVLKTNKSSYDVGDSIYISTPTTKNGYRYRFSYSLDNSTQKKYLTGFGSATQVAYEPDKAETYNFYLDIKDEFGNVYSGQKQIKVSTIKPVIKTDYDRYQIGTTIKISTPTLKSKCQYKFEWSCNNGKGGSGLIREYEPLGHASFIPQSVGSYELTLYVKNQFNQVFTAKKEVTVVYTPKVRKLVDGINAYRKKNGASILQVDPSLNYLAQKRAYERPFSYGHYRWVNRKRTAWHTIFLENNIYRTEIAEILGTLQETPEQVLLGLYETGKYEYNISLATFKGNLELASQEPMSDEDVTKEIYGRGDKPLFEKDKKAILNPKYKRIGVGHNGGGSFHWVIYLSD